MPIQCARFLRSREIIEGSAVTKGQFYYQGEEQEAKEGCKYGNLKVKFVTSNESGKLVEETINLCGYFLIL